MNPVRVVQDKNYAGMFRLQWEDGSLSAEMYNLSRSKDHLRRWEETSSRQERRQRAGGWSPVRLNERVAIGGRAGPKTYGRAS